MAAVESQKDDLIFNYHCCSRITPLENEDSLSLIKTVRNNNIYLFNKKNQSSSVCFSGACWDFFCEYKCKGRDERDFTCRNRFNQKSKFRIKHYHRFMISVFNQKLKYWNIYIFHDSNSGLGCLENTDFAVSIEIFQVLFSLPSLQLLDCCRHPWWCLTFQTCSQEEDAWDLLCFQSPSWHHRYRSKKKVSALNSKPTLVLLLVLLKGIPVDVFVVTLMGLEHRAKEEAVKRSE